MSTIDEATVAIPGILAPSALTSSSALTAEADLINRFQHDVEKAGLVGEKKNASTVFLTAISAKLDHPLSLTVQGPSSAGKNHLINTVAKFLPEDMKKILTGLSPKALMHAQEDEYEHKAVFIAEYEGVSGADYAIRTMQSERVIEWSFANTTSEGIRLKTNKVRGPASFIQATTRPLLHPENETRLLFVQMDESAELTNDILERQAKEAEVGAALPAQDLFEQWHAFIRTLKPSRVFIPFASRIIRNFPGRVRSRRDFQKLLSLIQVSAFLHQNKRKTSDQGIVADLQDYSIAKSIFENSYLSGPETSVVTLVRAARSATGEFTVADVMSKTGWGKSKTYEILQRAEDLGHVAPSLTRGFYRFLRDIRELDFKLPDRLD